VINNEGMSVRTSMRPGGFHEPAHSGADPSR
jgi:hypothetical protein